MIKEVRSRGWLVIAAVLIGCLAMIWIEAVWQPVYLYKSAAKIIVFLACILGYGFMSGDKQVFQVFQICHRRTLLGALALGAVVYVVILGGYFAVQSFIDFHAISQNLMSKENVSKENFIYVAVYISIVNSLLEELFFRGFAFLRLREYWNETKACLFSAMAFACYHIFIMSSWFTPVLFVLLIAALALAGALFNFLDRNGVIYNSWIVHMSANLAINTIGMMMFGLL